jgi:DNA-binding beta-propeller fold protein YncE
MRIHKSVLFNGLAFLCVIWATTLFTGCQSVEVKRPAPKPVFFPAPPEVPRLQFLKSFGGASDLGAVTVSPFERFVLGEPKETVGIAAPYGIAIFKGKLYVCDVGRKLVEVLDLRKRTFGYLTKDRRTNPVNIYIDDDGSKYVADPMAGRVFVFDQNDNLSAILGQQSKISPIDVFVRGPLCYVTDYASNQVVVLNKTTGKEVTRVGQKRQPEAQIPPLAELPPGEFALISNLALDQQGNIYVTDKAGGRITEFDSSGLFKRNICRLGDNIDEMVRPKGIAIDRKDRIWVVDAATEVGKIYNQKGQLLLFFGLPGTEPGTMDLPAKIILDYDDVSLFQQYAVPGAHIEFLVLVSNQYGPNKVSVYGFGTFPVSTETTPQGQTLGPMSGTERRLNAPAGGSTTGPRRLSNERLEQMNKVAEIYNASMAYYRAGQLEKAREGFVQVLNSGLIPGDMATTLKGYIADIDRIRAQGEQQNAVADLYYHSMALYRAGQLEKAREGFRRVLNSGSIPPAMAKTIKGYLADIDRALAARGSNRR